MTLESLFESGEWTTPPVAARLSDGVLRVTAAPESDAWRHTGYGFVHDTEHALLEPFGAEGSVEVSFRLDYAEQFDQAGVFIAASETEWIKAGVEISDGAAAGRRRRHPRVLGLVGRAGSRVGRASHHGARQPGRRRDRDQGQGR